ncbi:7tm 6 domain containing protein, partial [Asbolus verrucosus]
MRALGLYRPENSKSFNKVRAYFVYIVFVILISFSTLLYFLLGEELDITQINFNAAFLAEGGLACHGASQFMILQYTLQNLNYRAEKEGTSGVHIDNVVGNGAKFKVIYKKIKQCTEHHTEILSFVNEYEECFSFPIFIQFAASAFVVCFTSLQLGR